MASWLLERRLKHLENRSGGPISVHGATVLYRAEALEKVFQSFGSQAWINDDVVIPLALRCYFPEQHLVYLADTVVIDESLQSDICTASDYNRRIRLVQGNLEWISHSFWLQFNAPTILAMRRIFRLAWGFWLLCLLAPICIFGIMGLLSYFLVVSILIRLPAFVASLKAPLFIFFPRTVQWN
jgi:hypothetical protein